MRALTYYVATSIDGYIADAHDGWDLFPSQGDHIAQFIESLGWFDTVLMGRKTYQVGLDLGVTSPYPMLRQIVFSRSMTESPDPAVELDRGDALARVDALKAADGKPIWLCGGATLARTLWRAGRIDALVVKLNPILMGRGVPLFGGDGVDPTTLTLHRSERFESGVVRLHYRVTPAA